MWILPVGTSAVRCDRRGSVARRAREIKRYGPEETVARSSMLKEVSKPRRTGIGGATRRAAKVPVEACYTESGSSLRVATVRPHPMVALGSWLLASG